MTTWTVILLHADAQPRFSPKTKAYIVLSNANGSLSIRDVLRVCMVQCNLLYQFYNKYSQDTIYIEIYRKLGFS
jgi:hypothetical protein